MQNISTVLFVTSKDFEADSNAFRVALRSAANHNAVLRVLVVLPEIQQLGYSTSPDVVESISNQIKEKTYSDLESEIHQHFPTLSFTLSVSFGKMFFETIRFVKEHDCDLVIKRAEDPSWLSSIFGSDDLHLLRKCPCPVLLIPTANSSDFERIVVAVDLNEDDIEYQLNIDIVQQALSFAKPNNAKMHLVSIYDASIAGFASLWVDEPEKLEQSFLNDEYQRRQYAANNLIEEASGSGVVKCPFTKHIVAGDPGRSIPELVTDINADLVVMGTVGRSGVLGMLIGNTAETVLLQLNCAVLALKPKGFISPLHL